MKTFEIYCEEISSSVENKIYRWIHSAISPTQAECLLRQGYILGGLNISPSLITPLDVFTLNFQYTDRIDNNLRLIRDSSSLCNYYRKYISRYDACNDERDLGRLFTEIEQDLFNSSMEIIINTGEFGG